MTAKWEISEKYTVGTVCVGSTNSYRISVDPNPIEKIQVNVTKMAGEEYTDMIDVVPNSSVDIGPGIKSITITYPDTTKIDRETNERPTVNGTYEIIPTNSV